MQTRAAQARQPVAAATRARAQRHDRYEEQRAQVLEEDVLYSDSDSASTSFVESEEENLSEGEVTEDFISNAAAMIARCTPVRLTSFWTRDVLCVSME